MTIKAQRMIGSPLMRKIAYGLVLWLGCLNFQAFAASLNVLNYGAVPNDGIDDQAAINNAITAAKTGDTVLFPNGTFCVSQAIIGKTGVRLEGSIGSVVQYVGKSGGNILSLSSVSNVTVTGLTLDGNDSVFVKRGIAVSNGSGICLENLTVRNLVNGSRWDNTGILFDPSVTDSSITGSTITNIAPGTIWGAGIRIGHGSLRNRVVNNTIANTGRGGILCNDNSTDLVIRGNTVTGSGGEGLGIELWGRCHRGLIEENHIDHWLSVCSCDYVAARRNTVSDKSGIFKLCGLEFIDSRYGVFADNLVDGGAQIGISLSGPAPKEYAVWIRNTVQYCGTWGGQFMGETGGCSYLYFYQNKFIYTQGDYPPALYPDYGDGFRFNYNCHYMSFEKNNISNNDHDGIVTYGNVDQISFIENIITNNGNGGVWDAFGCDLEWSGNTVSGNHDGSADWNIQLNSRGFSNQKPVALFSSGRQEKTVSFINSSYDPDGSIDHVLWDFGDGIPSTEFNPAHRYENAGSYIVALTIWDNVGRAKLVTQVVTIPKCGDIQHIIPDGDINNDCRKNFLDISRFAEHWMECTCPNGCF